MARPSSSIDPAERMTNLLALLLETPVPLSLVQIGGELAGQYPSAARARRATFERDKAMLRDIGVPIDTTIVTGGPEAGQTRYRIDRAKYELSALDLAPDEMRALQVAVAAAHTGGGRDAIWKLGGTVDDEQPAVSAVIPELPALPALRSAIAARRPVRFTYRATDREVDPWGLLLRDGFWYVIGLDHGHGEQRTFRVDRIDGPIESGEPASFERPASFDPRAAFPSDPKRIAHDGDVSIEARVRIDAVRAGAVERELGAQRVLERGDDGSIVVLVPATNLPAFRSWVLGLLEHAVVLDPPEVRAHIVEWLGAIVEAAR